MYALKDINIPIDSLQYVLICEDKELLSFSYHSFDSKDQLIGYAKDHIEINSNSKYFNFEYSVHLVPGETIEILKQDTDRSEPDSFYKSIIEDEGVLIANNKDLGEYIKSTQEQVFNLNSSDEPALKKNDDRTAKKSINRSGPKQYT